MGRITCYLVRHYLDKWHTIACDNRFTTAELFEYLFAQHKTMAVGSLRPNTAQMPQDFKLLQKYKGKQRGDYVHRQSGRLLFTAWKDTTAVCLLSTNVDPAEQPGRVLRNFSGKRRTIPCPAPALSYTSNFNAVDKSNHLMSSFYVGRRCKKWHRYFFFHKLNQCLVNSRINAIFFSTKKSGRGQLQFRRALVTQLLAKKREDEGKRPRVLPSSSRISARGEHNLVRAPRSRRCKVCQVYRQTRHESSFWCSYCTANLCRPQLRDCLELHRQGLDKMY